MPKKLALLALIGFALGIGLGASVQVSIPFVLFLVLLSAGFLCAWFFGKRNIYLVAALLILSVAVGLGRVALEPRTVPTAFAPYLGTKVELSGMVAADPDIRESTQRLTVRVEENGVAMKILVVAERYPEFAYGDTVTVVGRLERPEPFATDGGRTFAYDRFLAKDGIFAIISHASIVKIDESTSLLAHGMRLLYGAKHRFSDALEEALPEPEAALAEGILTGGKQGLGKQVLDAFTIAGLLPIVVLSGYNVMIVAQAVLALLAVLPRRYALCSAALTVGLFVLAAGAGASAVRAGLMAGIGLFAQATRRRYDALRALALVFVFMLLLNPLLLFADPGFQFSFAATLGLIIAAPHFEAHLTWIRSVFLREITSTTLAAQLFVFPLLLHQTGNLSLIAIPANLLVLPVVPLAMAASAFAGVIALLVPPLGLFAGLPAFALLWYIVGVATWGAALPLAQVIVPAFSPLLLIPAYALVAFIVVRLARTTQSKISPRYSSMSRWGRS